MIVALLLCSSVVSYAQYIIPRDMHIPLKNCSLGSGFQCPNGECIPKLWVCDGQDDCNDMADEQNCTGRCSPSKFDCRKEGSEKGGTNGMHCIPKKWVCDGEIDCEISGKDEEHCHNGTELSLSDCPDDRYQCRMDGLPDDKRKDLGQTLCIPKNWLCDRARDCPMGDDEENCPKLKCDNNTYFTCADGSACIHRRWVCDRDDDCSDGSDEKNCPSKCNGDEDFICLSQERCVPKSWRCDGDADCRDGSDEHNCTAIINPRPIFSCGDGEFSCTDDQNAETCYPDTYKCDGSPDCNDWSDEIDCKHDQRTPCDEEIYFRCKSHNICVPKEHRCDDHADCYDGSDEENCTDIHEFLKHGCMVGEIPCAEKGPEHCISPHEVCNGHNDCPQGSDEENCTKQAGGCTENNGGCSQECRPATDGTSHVCACYKGYGPKDGSTTDCVDRNECEDDRCEHICINTPGSYHCKCHDRFILEPDRRTCRYAGPQHRHLFYAHLRRITQYDLINHSLTHLADEAPEPNFIDYLEKDKILVFSASSHTNAIYECNLDSADRTNLSASCSFTVVEPDEKSHIEGLAIDYVNYRLYYVSTRRLDHDSKKDRITIINNRKKQKIVAIDLDKNHQKTLFTGLSSPRGIALDPLEGLMFWTDWDQDHYHGGARIEVAGMDGDPATRKVIISGDRKLMWPNGIAVDPYSKRIFWADSHRSLRQIVSAKYDGSNYHVVADSGTDAVKHPFGIAVAGGYVYFTDWSHGGVVAVNRYNPDDIKTIARTHLPRGITVSKPYLTPEQADGRCYYHKCMYMCLPTGRMLLGKTPISAHCVCPDGITPPPGNPNCKGEPVTTTPDPGLTATPLTSVSTTDSTNKAALKPGQKPSIAGRVMLVLTVILGSAAVALLLLYRRLKHRAPPAFQHFANPIYPGTTMEATENGLENGIGLENGYGMQYEDTLQYHPTAIAFTPSAVNSGLKAPLTENIDI